MSIRTKKSRPSGWTKHSFHISDPQGSERQGKAHYDPFGGRAHRQLSKVCRDGGRLRSGLAAPGPAVCARACSHACGRLRVCTLRAAGRREDRIRPLVRPWGACRSGVVPTPTPWRSWPLRTRHAPGLHAGAHVPRRRPRCGRVCAPLPPPPFACVSTCVDLAGCVR